MLFFNKKIPVGATAIVTGASSGIGLEFSRALAEKGINVVLVSNQQEQLDEAAAELRQKYPQLRFEPVYKNLADADAAEWLLARCKSLGIEVDILINNAGIFNFMKVTDMKPERLDLFVDLHVRSVTQLCRTFARDMLERGCKGYIFNMASMCCWMPMPGIGAYAATKAYIRVLSRSMYLELKDYGISVTVACPGGISTELFGLSPKLRKLAVNIGALTTPQRFARNALRRMFNRRKQYINGLLNRIAIVAVNNLPTCLCVQVKHQLLDKNITR
ncbi:MAG: SDR family NAD(P)-dependent oxidoreductase [Bacteroidales bacterium]|nr:SDR family NAD(P)-dependent oxidoreductase [Bacteroidales bacterium]